MAPLYDLTCVIHVHSIYSDGTGSVDEIARAAARNAVDVVLLTDHDTLAARRRGEEGWHGSVLVLVGHEVSPRGRDHFLAFGVDKEISRRLPSAEICAAAREQGGFGFAAHPWSAGAQLTKRPGAMPWTDIDCDGLEGIEVWSFVTDTVESLRSFREAFRFIARPEQVIDHAPPRNVADWDRLGARRRVVGIGGLDAHQIGIRVLGRVPIRLMSYARSFRHLRTHVLCDEPPSGSFEHDRDQVYAALRSGRCYMAVDSLAPARGFTFEAGGASMGSELPAEPVTLEAKAPRPASLRLVKDGIPIASTEAATLSHEVEEPGVYRIEARLHAHGRERTWILSNPIYLR